MPSKTDFIHLIILMGLTCNLHAQELIHKEIKPKALRKGDTGQFTISLTEHNPLSSSEEFAKRFGWHEAELDIQHNPVGKRYDTTNELFEVYVPTDYQHGKSYGLFVWLVPQGNGVIPPHFKPILDRHRLIWIGTHKAGTFAPFWYRVGLAIDAVHNMKKRYTIDKKRVYVGGVLRGSRSASACAIAYPELFYGGLYMMGCNYFKKIPVPSKPGYYYSKTFKVPSNEILELVKKRNRYVFLTTEADHYYEQMKVTHKQYMSDGFGHIAFLDMPGATDIPEFVRPYAGHPKWFAKAIALLDAPFVTTSDDKHLTDNAMTADLYNRRKPPLLATSNPQYPRPPRKGAELELSELHRSPGADVWIQMPKTKSPFFVYIPTDYTPERSWPIIFSYPGSSGRIRIYPFKQVTGGQGFVIVGMPYATQAFYTQTAYHQTEPEEAIFHEVFDVVSSHLNIDPEMVFIGGVSQGGYCTTVLGEQLLDKLAGLIVIGAGRGYADRNSPPAKQIRGKPIFYGIGDLDEPHYPRAKNAVRRYRGRRRHF